MIVRCRLLPRLVLGIAFAALMLCSNGNLRAQQFGRGMVFNNEEYGRVEMTAKLTRGDYDGLPSKVSLKEYAPTPGNQGRTGTCTAWSTSYHARTIAESVTNERTNKKTINSNTFSPSYVYNQIRNDVTCENGTTINAALDLMVTRGVPKYTTFGFDCNAIPSTNVHQKASNFRIAGYKRLHVDDSNNKILPIKKALAEKKPVVFGMICPPSFSQAVDIWEPKRSDSDESRWEEFGGHAMVVVGYDDSKYGGAFQVMNSWGTDWGSDGFTWIKYKDYNRFTFYSFEMIESPPLVVDLSGDLRFVKADGVQMAARLDSSSGLYRMDQPYKSGTEFRLYITNHEPAYVYAFGSDATQKNFRIFPHMENVSPYLGYKGSNVAIPDEDHYIRMDETVGQDYFCVLYSKQKLDINHILSSIENETGSFRQRVEAVVRDRMVDMKKVDFAADGRIGFKAKSGTQLLVPIIVEFDHI